MPAELLKSSVASITLFIRKIYNIQMKELVSCKYLTLSSAWSSFFYMQMSQLEHSAWDILFRDQLGVKSENIIIFLDRCCYLRGRIRKRTFRVKMKLMDVYKSVDKIQGGGGGGGGPQRCSSSPRMDGGATTVGFSLKSQILALTCNKAPGCLTSDPTGPASSLGLPSSSDLQPDPPPHPPPPPL